MSADTISRAQHVEARLDEHIHADNDRFATLDRRLGRIECDVRSLLEWRWKLVGALGVIVFAATWFAGWLR